ncbi:hypothetical protein GCM10023259_061790 [Thermocatellispora tengchongensis]
MTAATATAATMERNDIRLGSFLMGGRAAAAAIMGALPFVADSMPGSRAAERPRPRAPSPASRSAAGRRRTRASVTW